MKRILPSCLALLALGALACSDPVAPPAQGGMTVNLKPLNPAQSGKACPSPQRYEAPDRLPEEFEGPSATTTSQASEGNAKRVVDGEGASVSCRVKKSGDGFSVSGNVLYRSTSFNVTEATLDSTGRGTGSVTLLSTDSQQFSSVGTCNFQALSDSAGRLQLKAGAIWARVDCPEVRDRISPADACTTEAYLVLENCSD